MNAEHLVQIICANPELAREYIDEFQNAGESFHLRPIAWLADARQARAEAERPLPHAFVYSIDELGGNGP